MAVKLSSVFDSLDQVLGHPCWKVQSALDEAGVQYEIVRRCRSSVGGVRR
jgi:hypothetical protein